MRSRLALCIATVVCAFVVPATASVGPTTKPVISPPLGLLKKADEPAEVTYVVTNFEVPIKPRPAGAPAPVDTVVQGVDVAHSPDVIGPNFEGVGVLNSAPPDTNGRVGKNHFVQWVNTQLAVWDKSGNLLAGPIKGNTLFKSLGGTCAAHNDGDPIAQYDILADRWILTQFAVFATDGAFSHQCVAVSMSGDPLGSYYLYDFRTSTRDGEFVDYPHVGIWPDGYYTTTHQFEPDGSGGFSFGGQGLYVFDRASMLAGLPASYQFHNFGQSDALGLFLYGGALPADLDSLRPPPAGSPGFVAQFGSPDTDGSSGFVVHVWQVKTTWGSSPTLNVGSPIDVPVAPFNEELCTAFIGTGILLGARPCVPQPPPAATTLDWLDGIPDRLMYRVAYRNFGDHESLVLNHTVNASGHQAGVRWYELRNPGGVPTLLQQGTYSGPTPDTQHRWMGSIAQDNSGNILLGYSKSSVTLLPEIDVAGRLASDPLGTLGREILMKAGGGVQIGTGNRWGDYSGMTVDPLDGCSFWFTSEYLPGNGSFNWRTRIGSFRYSSCVAPPQGTIQGTVTDCATAAPLSRAMVQTDNGFSAATDSNGHYAITLPPGNYSVSASAPDRLCAPSTASQVSVTSGGSVTKNFCLTGSPKLQFKSAAIDDSAASNNGVVNKDECVKLSVTVANNGCGSATRVSGTLSTSTPGVTVTQPNASYGTIARDGSAANVSAFSFSTSSANGFQCGAPIDFTLALASDQASNSIRFSIPTCQGAPVSNSGSITTGDQTQNARMGRNSSASACGVKKSCPGPLGSGNRHFDSYTFTNNGAVSACINVNITADPSCSGGNQIFSVAYLDSYDPQNLCTNYAADEGSSPDLGFNNYAFDVPSGRNFVVVVDSVQPDGTFVSCPAYKLTVSGLIDNTTVGGGSCPAPPVTTCLEDNDPSISYANGWHLANSANASAGHFRFNASTNTGTSASLTVNVPSGSTGTLKYNFAKSTKGGSADVYLDGAFRETISYLGTTGGMKDPVFGFSSSYSGLASGTHTFELRNMKGVAYIDGFCLTSASSSGTPSSGPGATTTSSGTPGAGLGLLQNIAVPPGGTAISSVAESSVGVPIQLLILSPTGALLASSTSTSGITVAEASVSDAGTYVVKTINLSLGPVSVWTATTPQVNR